MTPDTQSVPHGRQIPYQPDPMTPCYWPGMSRGVRQPDAGETPLSWDEVEHGVKQGVL